MWYVISTLNARVFRERLAELCELQAELVDVMMQTFPTRIPLRWSQIVTERVSSVFRCTQILSLRGPDVSLLCHLVATGALPALSSLTVHTSQEVLYDRRALSVISANAIDALSAAFESGRLSGLTRLDMSTNEIQGAAAAVLSAGLCATAPQRLEVVDLSDNLLGDVGMRAFSRCLADLCRQAGQPSVKSLFLGRNSIGPSEMAAFEVRGEVMSRLLRLDLEGNRLQCGGLTALSSVLVKMPALEWLILSHNLIGDSGLATFASILSADDKQLLDDGGNLRETDLDLLKKIPTEQHHLRVPTKRYLQGQVVYDEYNSFVSLDTLPAYARHCWASRRGRVSMQDVGEQAECDDWFTPALSAVASDLLTAVYERIDAPVLARLKHLDLHNNEIQDLRPLCASISSSSLRSLVILNLYNNPLRSADGLLQLAKPLRLNLLPSLQVLRVSSGPDVDANKELRRVCSARSIAFEDWW